MRSRRTTTSSSARSSAVRTRRCALPPCRPADPSLTCFVLQWGERPHAYVVLKPGSSWHGKHAEFEASVKGGLRGKISAFAIPEWIEVVKPEDLPKTSTGKIQKVALRERVKKLK